MCQVLFWVMGIKMDRVLTLLEFTFWQAEDGRSAHNK